MGIRRLSRFASKEIRAEIENSDSDYDREKLQERLAKLAGGVAVIKVGAATEVELKERKHRIEDAVRNAKAAVEEGLLPGGGVALANAAATAFDKLDLVGDEATGANIVRVALTAPLKQIAINAGLEGGVVSEKVSTLEPGHGLNAATGDYVDMFKEASSNPRRSPAPRCKTPPRSQRSCSPPRSSSPSNHRPRSRGSHPPEACCRETGIAQDRTTHRQCRRDIRDQATPAGKFAAGALLARPAATPRRRVA